MIDHKQKCSECGEEFTVYDIRNVPATCGKRECLANYRYRQRMKDPLTGRIPTPEQVKKLK